MRRHNDPRPTVVDLLFVQAENLHGHSVFFGEASVAVRDHSKRLLSGTDMERLEGD